MIQLIASDLDGTLLQNGAQTLNPCVFEYILKLKDRGILFVAASGRQYANLRRLFEPVKDEIAYVSENGSLCISNHQVLSKGSVPQDFGLRIIDAIRKLPHCDCIVSGIDTCYTDSTNERFINHMLHIVGNNMTFVRDLKKDVMEDILKISACDFLTPSETEQQLKDLFGKEIKIATSGNIWIDFITPGADKGSALQALLSHLEIDPENCMAFGDQYNDVEMLKLAGTSYAMSNAAPGITSCTTYVTSSVEEVLHKLVNDI